MADGDSSRMGLYSALMVGEEAAFGTFETDGSFFPFLSESMKFMREKKVIESINSTRDRNQLFQANETVEGSIECDYNVAETGINYLIKQAFGGTVSTVLVTTGSGNYEHTFNVGNMDNNDSSVAAADVKAVSIYVRRGETNTGAWAFTGNRVNQVTFKGEIGQPVKVTFEMIGQGATLTTFTPTIAHSAVLPLLFSGVGVYEAPTSATLGSVTVNVFQSFEVTLQNNLQSDEKARRLGSRALGVLPPAMRAVSVKLTQRFDTTTAYTKFTSNTFSALRILMDSGVTVGATTGATTYSAFIDLYKVYWHESQPEVSDPGIISTEIQGTAIADSLGGVSISMKAYNATTGY